jgi:hypothetical protein
VFVAKVNSSGHKWVVLVNHKQSPQLVLDADGYLRSLMFSDKNLDSYIFCHRPVIIRDKNCTLGRALSELKQAANLEEVSTDVLNHDLVILWTSSAKRVITGADVLGRLLKGIGHENG